MQTWIILEATIGTTPQRKNIVGYRTPNHRLVIEIGDRGWLSLPLEKIVYATCALIYNVVENEAHFVSECPLHNSIRDKFQ